MGQDTMGQDTMGQDTMGQDTMSQDTMSQDTMGQDTMSQDTMSQEPRVKSHEPPKKKRKEKTNLIVLTKPSEKCLGERKRRRGINDSIFLLYFSVAV